jgi:hypothetical protein
MLAVCFRFCKIIFDGKLMKFMSISDLGVLCEINNDLFNGSVLYFVNFIAELKFSVNV